MHLLLALDGSEEATEALDFVMQLPFSEKPRITLISVLADIITDEVGRPLREAAMRQAQERLGESRVSLERLGYDVNEVIEYGHPSRLIVDRGRDLDVDLIVLGARGHSAAYRVIVGSTANFVANHARCAVLIVRPNKADERGRLNLMLAFDGSPQAKIAFEQMMQFSWTERNARITLATLFEKPHLLGDDELYDAESVAAGKATLASLCGKANSQCEFEVVSQEAKHIGDALRDLAADGQIDLLFMGDTGKSAIARFFLGSISRYLLHHTYCSLWIARNKDW